MLHIFSATLAESYRLRRKPKRFSVLPPSLSPLCPITKLNTIVVINKIKKKDTNGPNDDRRVVWARFCHKLPSSRSLYLQ